MNRFVFLNPHTIWFKKNINCFLLGTRSISKYDFLFDHFYYKHKKVHIVIDDPLEKSFFNGFLSFLNSKYLYFYLWVLLNKLNPFKFTIISSLESLNKNDVLFGFYYENLTYSKFDNRTANNFFNLSKKLSNSNAYKIFHLTHYVYNLNIGLKNLKCAKPNLLIAENNLKKSSNYYNNFFKYDWDFYTLPFVYHKKFKKFIKFKNRKDKAYAFGSITHEINDSHFIKFFKTSNLQPSRNLIFNNKEKLKNQIDSYINNGLREKNWDKDLPKRSFFRFLFSDFYKIIRLLIEFTLKIPKINNELNYFKNDIVAQINEYKMFVCPHEICDLPGIGFVEGMACGAAFIAEKNSMYNNLGMIDGVHYITYDGSIKDLIIKIKYYQKHSDELEQIAENGYKFAIENFNSKKVIQNFINYLNIKT